MAEEPLQKSLDRYDVLDRIAVGGMAEVFLAKAYGAHGFEKTIAIKRILPELASDPEFAARFIAEAKVAVRLSHANVVQVFDFGRIGESLFIAMEFVDGCDLAALIRKFKDEKRQIPLPAAFHIAIEIIRALDFAHGHNVVHRDVSPSNILISRAGEVKLGDFGIAVAAAPHATSKPGPKRVMGKWRYMSPEQARGDTLDTRSDLFSAASVLYELFTTEKLFPGDEAEDILKNIHDMAIPKMSSVRAGLPSRLDEVLSSVLQRKPIDRPTRPATVLRSLIELSYESSIMATALDVAEAVAAVVPPRGATGRGALDDVIRKQMADQSIARQTAVTGKPPATATELRERRGDVSTGLFRKIDIDGLSRLEESAVGDDPMDRSADDNPATATNIAAPRARRASQAGDVAPQQGDSTDLHRLFDASQDRDRRTEVGSPPPVTAPVAKVEPSEDKPFDEPPKTKTKTQTKTQTKTKTGEARGEEVPIAATEPSRRGMWVAIAAVVAAGGGVAVWQLAKSPARTVVTVDAAPAPVKPIDAAPIVAKAHVILATTPPGAHGTLGGVPFATTPATIDIPPGKGIPLVIELAGWRRVDKPIDVDVAPGESLHWPEALAVAPALLDVTTTPPGARATLDGKTLGDTPLRPIEVDAKTGADLVLAKPDYEPVHVKLDLVAGGAQHVTRELKASQRFGFVEITVTGARYVTVFSGGANLGRSATLAGPNPIRLTAGKHALDLVTPAGKHKAASVVIPDKGTAHLTVAVD